MKSLVFRGWRYTGSTSVSTQERNQHHCQNRKWFFDDTRLARTEHTQPITVSLSALISSTERDRERVEPSRQQHKLFTSLLGFPHSSSHCDNYVQKSNKTKIVTAIGFFFFLKKKGAFQYHADTPEPLNKSRVSFQNMIICHLTKQSYSYNLL